MKKLFITAIALFALSSANFASDYEFIHKLNDKTTFRNFSYYIGADSEQREALKYIFDLTEKKKEAVLRDIANGKATQADLDKVLFFNLANVKVVLSESQYRDYLIIVNLTESNQAIQLLTERK